MNLFVKPSLYVKDKNSKKKNKEILSLIKEKLENSAFYTEESVKLILNKLKHHNFCETSIQVILKQFREEPCLNLEEKKQYGINTHQKINKNYFNLLTEVGKHQEYILTDLENIILSSEHKIHNKYELLECKALGIKNVQISCCNDDRDCPAVKKYCNRIYPINAVPELPLPECTADVCRCIYLSVISEC